MKRLLFSIAIVSIAAVPPVIAQTTGQSTSSSTRRPQPQRRRPLRRHFLRIRPPARPRPRRPAIPSLEASPSSEAPGNLIPPPIETNRLDPSAPTPLELQIGGGDSSSSVANPNSTVTTITNNPTVGGSSYNSILQGAPSNDGLSTGGRGKVRPRHLASLIHLH